MKKASLFALLVLVALNASAGFWYSGLFDSDSVDKLTQTKVLKHTLRQPAVGARLTLGMKLSEGEATVRLVDPAGAKRYEKTFRAGKASIEETFRGENGQWQIFVDFRGATGRYSVKLVGM
jgi:hypothetical protein